MGIGHECTVDTFHQPQRNITIDAWYGIASTLRPTWYLVIDRVFALTQLIDTLLVPHQH